MRMLIQEGKFMRIRIHSPGVAKLVLFRSAPTSAATFFVFKSLNMKVRHHSRQKLALKSILSDPSMFQNVGVALTRDIEFRGRRECLASVLLVSRALLQVKHLKLFHMSFYEGLNPTGTHHSDETRNPIKN